MRVCRFGFTGCNESEENFIKELMTEFDITKNEAKECLDEYNKKMK